MYLQSNVHVAPGCNPLSCLLMPRYSSLSVSPVVRNVRLGWVGQAHSLRYPPMGDAPSSTTSQGGSQASC
eukprot:5226554-Amphidinium_carterae.1